MTDIVERLRSTSEPLMINHWGRTALEGEAAAEIECLRGALAEARGLLGAFYRADIDMYKYDRTAQWLERNP